VGNFAGGAAALDEGLKKFNNDPVLLNWRGNAAMAMGKFEEALTNYRKCIEHIGTIRPMMITDEQNPDANAATAVFTSELYNSISLPR